MLYIKSDVLLFLALLAGLMPVLVSCDAGSDVVVRNDSDAGMIVTMHLCTGDIMGSTRAPELSNDDNSVEENRIDIEGNDYCILIFRRQTTADGTEGMVFQERFVPLSVQTIEGSKERLYALQGVVSVASGLKTGTVAQENMAIMVLANWRSFGCEYDDILTVSGVTTIDDVVGQARNKPFRLPTDKSPAKETLQTWQPYVSGHKGIPMCGVKEFEMTSAAVRAGGEISIDEPVMLLRAVAKIEIIDNLYEGKRDGVCGVKVAAVSRYNKTGTLICDMKRNPEWHVEEVQVTTPTLPLPRDEMEQGSDLGMLPAGNDGEGRPVYAAYVPEFDMRGLEPGDVLRPAIKLQIRKPGRDTELLGYIVDIADYGGGTTPTVMDNDPNYSYLLRNHIYRFELVGSPDNPERRLVINYTVCPWDVRTAGDIRFE